MEIMKVIAKKKIPSIRGDLLGFDLIQKGRKRDEPMFSSVSRTLLASCGKVVA